MKDDPGSVQQRVQSAILTRALVGNYEIVRKIGEGSFSSVFLASHIMTRHEVVLKSVNKTQSNLAAEIANMSLLSHPHIVRLYEYIIMPDKVWLVLEYCGGEELLNYLVKCKGGIPQPLLTRLFSQLAGAVAYAHQLNCAHRDLKLENVLLDAEGNIKLGDFGFTRSYMPRTFLETVCGTESYMAPELLLRKRYLPEASDVWSLGVILYALIYGKLPFDEENTTANVRKIVEEDPVFYAVPPDTEFLVGLVKKMLQKNPHQRPGALEMLELLGEQGKQQHQILQNIVSAPKSKFMFSSKEERTVLKGMKALSIDLHTMASSVVHHKCDPLHGLWFTALDRHILQRKQQSQQSIPGQQLVAALPAAAAAAAAAASLKVDSPNDAQMHSQNDDQNLPESHEHPSSQYKQLQQLSEQRKQEISAPHGQQSSQGMQSLHPSRRDYKNKSLSDPQDLVLYSKQHKPIVPAPATYNTSSPTLTKIKTASAPKASTSAAASKSKITFKKLLSALKIQRGAPKETLMTYYEPNVEHNHSSVHDGTLGLSGDSPFDSHVVSPDEPSDDFAGDSSSRLALQKKTPSTPLGSRRQSMASIASSISFSLADTGQARIARDAFYAPPSDTQGPSKKNQQLQFQPHVHLSPTQSQSQQSQPNESPSSPPLHSQASQQSLHHPSISRPMSTYSQVSQISQLSQSSIEASKLLAEANSSLPGSPQGPSSGFEIPENSPGWRPPAKAKRYAMASAPASTSSTLTPIASRQRARMINLKGKIPHKIDEGESENEQ